MMVWCTCPGSSGWAGAPFSAELRPVVPTALGQAGSSPGAKKAPEELHTHVCIHVHAQRHTQASSLLLQVMGTEAFNRSFFPGRCLRSFSLGGVPPQVVASLGPSPTSARLRRQMVILPGKVPTRHLRQGIRVWRRKRRQYLFTLCPQLFGS